MSKVFIIAEAGVNHNGDLDMAYRLVDAAKASGADAVKFQTFKAELLVSRNAQKAEYQKKATNGTETQFEMIKKLELSIDDHHRIAEYCKSVDIEFLSTAFDEESIRLLYTLGIRMWKIPSGEITNLPYLRSIAKLKMPIVMSTGMCTLGDVEAAIDALVAAGASRTSIVLLHCTTEYPAPIAEVNLKAMVSLGTAFNLPYGYSDHTNGITVPVAAVAMGAAIIEKHFTLDKGLPGPDHKASLDPRELAEMVCAIRNVEAAMGDGIKKRTVSEEKNLPIARKSIVARKKIAKGERLDENNLTVKRPGDGISPMFWDEVVSRKALRDYLPDEKIEW